VHPRANPTIASYNASVVNFYNATGSLARFKNIFFSSLKNAVAYYNAGVVAVTLKSRRIGSWGYLHFSGTTFSPEGSFLKHP
jgi:hypothetical protein